MFASATQMHSESNRVQRARLPILEFEEALCARLEQERRLVLVAETGSGKTTQLPQMLLRARSCPAGQIVVLQPRRLAARAVARRVAFEMGTREGELVGYRTRYERVESAATRILFMTDGLFVRLAQGSPDLAGISTVVLDEFHERGISSDLAAGIVRTLQAHRRRDLRLVVMSATLDAARLAEVFEVDPVSVSGRMYPVEIRHLGDSARGDDLFERTAGVVADALDGCDGDGLVFMPGRKEIEWTLAALRARMRASPIELLALHGGQTPQEQDRALQSSGVRKVVVATNIAETSLTIPGIRFVVDSGLARVHRFDPLRDLNTLVVEPISQASARQRAGRAGRTAPGLCLRLWSERSQGQRAAFETAEVHRIDLAEPLMSLLVIGEREVAGFPWIDEPKAQSLHRAHNVLRMVGATDANGALTDDGRAIARIPAHPRVARALLEGVRRGCASRVALWSALLTERDPVERDDPQALRAHLELHDRHGDLIARERALSAWKHGAMRGVSLDGDAVREVFKAAHDLEASARRAAQGVAQRDRDDAHSDEAIATSFMLGFPDRIAWRPDRQRPHAPMLGRRRVSIEPRSLHDSVGPLLAFEVRHKGTGDSLETALSMTVALERAWVESALPNRFTRQTHERWLEQSQSVEEVEEVSFDETPIEQTRRPARDALAAASLIAAHMVDDQLRPDDWSEQVDPWIARTRWVAALCPQRGLVTYSDDDLRILFAELATGATRFSQVRGRPSLAVIMSALSYDDQQFVSRMAPAAIRLSSGHSMKLNYEPNQPPRGRAKIQDLYGVDETPRIADGRVTITIEILGPNSRPLQVTSDIAAFWKVLYPQLVPALRRRYPRHTWR